MEERGEVFSCIDSGVIIRRLTQHVLERLPKSATVAIGGRDLILPESCQQ